jgi:hypothetical protein
MAINEKVFENFIWNKMQNARYLNLNKCNSFTFNLDEKTLVDESFASQIALTQILSNLVVELKHMKTSKTNQL